MSKRKATPHIRATQTTERIDGILWRKLSDTVTDDGEGGYWVPERSVIDCSRKNIEPPLEGDKT